MNKVLVTGPALGKDAGICEVCNYDYEWLLRHPSVLIWADRILISEGTWQTIQECAYPHTKETAESCKLIFDLAKDRGLVEVIKLPAAIQNLAHHIESQVEHDFSRMMQIFPRTTSRLPMTEDPDGPALLSIDDYHYCANHIASAYAGLVLSRIVNANCLFGTPTLHYMRHKFGIEGFPIHPQTSIAQSFAQVFEAYYPDLKVLPDYALRADKECALCPDRGLCSKTYLGEVEKSTLAILKWRDYDEIQLAKGVVEQIIKRRDEQGDSVNPTEIAEEFHNEQTKVLRRVRSVFPRIRRWASVATIISVPVAVIGLSTGALLLTSLGAGVAGIAKIGEEYTRYLESRYSWISFLSQAHHSEK